MFLRHDPDQWLPSEPGVYMKTDADRLEIGSLIIWERKPYRLIEVREVQHVDWPEKYRELWVEHGMPNPGTWRYRPRVVVARHEDKPQAKPVHLGCSNSAGWYVLPEHYAVCRLCGELPPCRHVYNEGVMERATERMAKEMSILPGVCHGCREPITKRQKSFTFPGANLIRPDLGDDSVIFHTRRDCLHALRSYDERWAAAEDGRTRLFFCEGTLTTHHDGTNECSSPQCTAQGERRGLVNHSLGIWHHPGDRAARAMSRMDAGTPGCWCLADAA